MENASKALLIAGSVLIVILIIGIGMAIYSGAMGSIDSAMSSMTSDQITQFNSKFEMYEGVQKGSQVRTLLNTVATSNGNYDANEDGYIVVKIESTDYDPFGTNELTTGRGAILPASKYKVELKYGNTGLIEKITITKQ